MYRRELSVSDGGSESIMDRIIRRSICLGMVFCLLLLAVSCGGTRGDDGEQVAKVNDTVITSGQFTHFSTLLYYLWGYDPSEMSVEEKQYFLDTMVEGEVLRQYYEEQGEDIYDDAYDSGKSSFVSSIRESSADFLEENGISEDDLIYYYRSSYLTQKFYGDVQAAYGEEKLQADAQAYYDEHKEDYRLSEEEGGGYRSIDEVRDEINYALYNKAVRERIASIEEEMDIEKTTFE